MGKYVAVTDYESAWLSLTASCLSVVTCLMVVVSIQLDSRNSKKSYHLRLVQRLLMSDIGLSSCVIFYYIMQLVLSFSDLKILCKLYLPLVDYFFLVSYGWTVMLAFRFRDSFIEKKITGIPKTMWKVWAVPAVFAMIVLIAAFASDDAVTVESSDAHTNRSCTFNHNTATGIALDLSTFQGPLLITIVLNCFTYLKGLRALSNTPQSVMARQMRKAGGYLGVLLIIWVPNIIYNFLSMFVGNDRQYNGFLDLVIFLSALQGFLNVCVYVWSDPQMKQWFWKHLFCFIPFRPADPPESDSNVTYQYNNRNTFEDDEGEEYDPPIDPNESEWLGDNNLHESLLSSSGNNNINSSTTTGNNEQGDGAEGEDRNIRESRDMTGSTQSRQSLRQARHSGSYNAGGGGSSNSHHKTKSILIAANNSKAIETKRKQGVFLASSADLDHERFVRFGENQVRVVSMANSMTSTGSGGGGGVAGTSNSSSGSGAAQATVTGGSPRGSNTTASEEDEQGNDMLLSQKMIGSL